MLPPLPQGLRQNMKPRKPRATPKSKRPTSRKSPARAPSNANAKELALYERIAQRAYELYEQRGRQAGSALEDWLQAEREIRSAAGMPKRKWPHDSPLPAEGEG